MARLTSFYRLAMRLIRGPADEWCESSAGPWGHALRGSSALRASVMRALGAELGEIEHQATLLLLWDIEAFYDNIRVELLVSRALDEGYPAQVLALGLIGHSAPRLFRVGDCISEPVSNTTRSILARCAQSNNFARAMLA